MGDSMQMAAQVRALITPGMHTYEYNAIQGVARSWELDDPACRALALADAQVWATLYLAHQTANVAAR